MRSKQISTLTKAIRTGIEGVKKEIGRVNGVCMLNHKLTDQSPEA